MASSYSLDLNLTLFLCQALLLEERANEQKVELSELLVQSNLSPKVVLGRVFDSCMLGLAVYFAQTALQHAQQVSAINKS